MGRLAITQDKQRKAFEYKTYLGDPHWTTRLPYDWHLNPDGKGYRYHLTSKQLDESTAPDPLSWWIEMRRRDTLFFTRVLWCYFFFSVGLMIFVSHLN